MASDRVFRCFWTKVRRNVALKCAQNRKNARFRGFKRDAEQRFGACFVQKRNKTLSLAILDLKIGFSGVSLSRKRVFLGSNGALLRFV